VDALKDQWSARETQLQALVAENGDLAEQISLFNDQVSYNKSTQNPNFSAVWNDIAAWKIAFAAFETKVFDFKQDLDSAQATFAWIVIQNQQTAPSI
jgi:hypothetical protein